MDLSSLNERQKEVVLHSSGPAVVLAGAGSGKTHTLISRVAYLIEQGTPASSILAITFTNAAADELKKRSAALGAASSKNVVACTYHKFCNMILRQYGYKVGLPSFTILSASKYVDLINYVKSSNPVYENIKKKFPSGKKVSEIISMQLNNDMALDDILKTEKFEKYYPYRDLVAELVKDVHEYCFKEKLLSFDDLLVYMNRLLDDPYTCQKVAACYQYIMVDEFQDTNNLQEQIVFKIFQYNRNIMVVGDISQSIYAFRGANVKNLMNFSHKMGDCQTYILDYNYRSVQEILDTANSVMQSNVSSWRYFNMKSPFKKGSAPYLIRCADPGTEAFTVLNLICTLNLDIPLNEIAVIERSSRESFQLENELTKNKIPFIKYGGTAFAELQCIGDMIAYLTLITDPKDRLSWHRILQLHPGIGETMAKKIADLCENSDFLINNDFKKRKFYPELTLLNEKISDWSGITDLKTVFDAVADFYLTLRQRLINEGAFRSEEAVEEEISRLIKDRANIEALRSMTDGYHSVGDFVDDIVLDSVSDDTDKANALTITTVHSAKGLEWEAVILLDCVEGFFPAHISEEMQGSEEDEEELRCFYVAITRAKKHLFLCAPGRALTQCGWQMTELSHYLKPAVKTCKILRETDIEKITSFED